MKTVRIFSSLLWLNILSFDAPLVAIVWQYFLARLHNRPLEWFHPILLGSVTWLAYAADRILDGLRSGEMDELSPRHSFAIRHRKPLLVAWVLVFAMTLSVGIAFLDAQHFWRGIFLTLGVSIYFALVFLLPRVFRRVIPREFAVSVFIVIGTSFFIFEPVDLLSLEILSTLTWFGALCFINCILISFWEQEIDLQKEEVSAATTLPDLAGKASGLIGAAVVVAMLAWIISPWSPVRLVLVAVLLSLVLLWSVNRMGRRQEMKPVLADLALLTPLLIFGFL